MSRIPWLSIIEICREIQRILEDAETGPVHIGYCDGVRTYEITDIEFDSEDRPTKVALVSFDEVAATIRDENFEVACKILRSLTINRLVPIPNPADGLLK